MGFIQRLLNASLLSVGARRAGLDHEDFRLLLNLNEVVYVD